MSGRTNLQSVWDTQQMLYGLTREQKDRCLEIMRRGASRNGGAAKNPGWWLFREPSIGNPPWLVIMRLRGGGRHRAA